MKNEIEKAIEILRRDKDSFEKVNHGGFTEKIKAFELAITALEAQQAHTWIPVTKSLPDANKDVQVTFKEFAEWNNKYLYGICKAIYIPEHSIKSEDMGWYDCESVEVYDEKEDVYYVQGGWYEVIENWSDYTHIYINSEVIAWKPLDAPWKED